jgi:Leucine-rich repeat (LRR) protein
MKLTIGSIYLGRGSSDVIELSDAEDVIRRFSISEISRPRLGEIADHLDAIDEVIVGFVEQPNIDFLRFLPNVTNIWILSPYVKDIGGLRYLTNIKNVAIDRPTCRMDVLGELSSLEYLYIDDWRPGANSIFRLKNLVKVGIQKFASTNLQEMSNWRRLSELWINAGRLEDLHGIPNTIERLRLTNLRKLDSLLPLNTCPKLEDLRLSGCRKVRSLNGVERCFQLRVLSVAKGGTIESLEPLRNLKNLEYVLIGEGTPVNKVGIDVLYDLPKLKRLIIPKQSGLEKDILLRRVPGCEITLTR